MEFLHLGNIPQSLQGVNARETCTSFWTGRSENFFEFFLPTLLRGGGGFDTLCTRSPPIGVSGSILEKRWCQERGPEGRSPARGSAGRDAEHERREARAGRGREVPASRRTNVFFSESLILAQNERW